MLPKVATQILHHTSRAAVAAQNQTSHTIRNVLHLQSSNSSGSLPNRNGPSSSSHWGDNGTQYGGSKFSAGGRFQYGFIGTSRAIAQSGTPTQHDGNYLEGDDTDERTPKVVPLQRYTSRRRSHSLSVGAQVRHRLDDKLAILETVQRHARSRHAFVQPSSKGHPYILPFASNNAIPLPPIPPISSLGHSLFAQQVTSPSQTFETLSSPPTALHDLVNTTPSSETPTPLEISESRSSIFHALKAARDSGDHARAIAEVLRFRESAFTPSVLDFNMAIETLCDSRRPGDSLALILELYNDMVRLSLPPSIKAYLCLLQALTDRDEEVQKAIDRLEIRRKRRLFSGRTEVAANSLEEERMASLRAETNFSLAVSLFEIVVDLKANGKIPMAIYINLLRSCSNHCDVDMAIRVFAQLEKRSNILPSAAAFGHLITTYAKAGDIRGAKDVFDEFKTASQLGRIAWLLIDSDDADFEAQRHTRARSSQLMVWNRMIDAYFLCGQPAGALNLLEQMMDTTADENFGTSDVPPPASSTFSVIISGFCRSGDVQTALAWFDRLLQQEKNGRHPYESSVTPLRPDQYAWMIMLESLAFGGMIKELNQLFLHLLENATRDSLEVRATDRVLIFQANMNDLQISAPTKSTIDRLDFVLEHILLNHPPSTIAIHSQDLRNMVQALISQYLKYHSRDKALEALERFVDVELEAIRGVKANGPPLVTQAHHEINNIRRAVSAASTQFFSDEREISLEETLRLMRVSDSVGLLPSRTTAQHYLRAYNSAKRKISIQGLTLRDWELLALASTTLELSENDNDVSNPSETGAYIYGTLSILQDLATASVDLTMMSQSVIRRIVKALSLSQDAERLSTSLVKLGPSYEKFLRSTFRDLGIFIKPLHTHDVLDNIKTADNEPIHIDSYHSRFINEFFPCNPIVTPLVAYARYESGLKNNLFPDPATMGRLISALGRLGAIDKARKLYFDAQRLLVSLEKDKKRQSQAWFNIEDQMIIACAHAGDLDAAHAHRERILAQGGTPTADSYGALIECVKDTTDDTSNALALFQEAQRQGVLPNIYLYNNIISKLAKARKADFALELFQQMKANQIQPSSITYGTVIAACARVGDAYSAELLFTEMVQQRNYKSRIPPFNTMMQLYAHTKPNRERVLYYYNALINANIRPTAHTYKLLIDAYGSIEPVDINSMENMFQKLENDPHVQVQGSHWAAVINAWGCVKKDLDKAITVFESIAHHPSTYKSPTILPDAVTFEALINVFMTHRRTDLIPQYIERLEISGVHMTAYIANCLIKGYATVGDLEQSRRIFESLQDPPKGVAAPNNHVSHHPSPSFAIPVTAPVYREPSTWEVMVRAELGNGNRDRAIELLDRMQARKFPPAVYNRIRGIMFNDSSLMWPQEISNPYS